MRALIVSEALVTGGAETFVLRLAAALRVHGHDASLFVLRGDLVNAVQVSRLAEDVPLVAVHVPLLRLVLKLDGLLHQLGSRFSLLRWIQVSKLRKHLLAQQPVVVHSHLLTADWVASRACETLGIPWVSTMHGDYLALETKGGSRAARIPDFHAALREIEPSVGHMVCITDQQTEQLSRLMPSLARTSRLSKIYNGYAASKADLAHEGLPDALSFIPENAFVAGMVARGIRDKGWDVLISAFTSLDLPDAWLVLVGDGDYLQQIRGRIQHPRIVFVGNVIDPLRYIKRFDVGCLPSQFPAESLPTVVIEYMVLGKPVVATAVGEIPKMLETAGAAPAGLLIELAETSVMSAQMRVALSRLYENKSERAWLGVNAVSTVKKFDMDVCVDAYLDVYAGVRR
jgi:L-malate glycosyltransferase